MNLYDKDIYNEPNQYRIILIDKYRGIGFRLVALASHPCAYIKISYDKVKPFEDELPCHFGLSYEGDYPLDQLDEESGWIGWDYGHALDYINCRGNDFEELNKGNKKWTLEEIICEIKETIDFILDNAKKTNENV